MLETKLFEIRDKGTFIPAIGTRSFVRVEPGRPQIGFAELYLMRRAGYNPNADPLVLLTRLEGQGSQAYCDPYDWTHSPRTMHVAHLYIQENWDSLESGAVVDVEFILRERANPKQSERITNPI